MSQITRLITTTAIAVIVTIVVMLFVTRTANAQVGRTAVCSSTYEVTGTPQWENAVWMNAQLKAGKTQFIQIGANGAMLCAW